MHAVNSVQVYKCYLAWYVYARYGKCTSLRVLFKVVCVHTMKNVHVNEYCLGWHVYTHTGQVSAKGKGKESFTDISQ